MLFLKRFFLLSYFLLSYLAPSVLAAQTVVALPKLDPDHFAGTWYEIARLPNKRQKNCANNAVLLVAAGDKPNQYQLETSCTDKKSYNDTRNFTANSDRSGVLRIRTLWPFSRPFWVFATGPHYEWVLVGTPNHKELWIYSSTLTLSPEMLADVQAKAVAQGFQPDKLITTVQKPR